MTPVGAKRDPKSIVTPDALTVSPELLGMRLASPRRRLFAIWIDLIVIAIVTAVTRNFALILGVVAAVLLIRAGFKRQATAATRATAVNRAMRGSVGCLGVVIGLVTIVVWISMGPSGSNDDDERLPELSPDGLAGIAFNALGPRAVREVYAQAGDLAEAEAVTRDLIDASGGWEIPPGQVRSVLIEGVPDDAPWAEEAPAMIDRLLAEVAVPAEPVEAPEVVAARAEIAAYTTDQTLEAYAALLRSGGADSTNAALRTALEARLVGELAADTLGVLSDSIAELSDDLDEALEDLGEVEAELDASTGFFGTVRSWIDELGFGFGWASLYFTVMMTWWKGQTIGKRLCRMRVLRLDGGPITWWVAFERAGGYAAGLATGLLGFAQIFWDANRQAIHDRIVGTVVALDPPQKVIDWQSHL